MSINGNDLAKVQAKGQPKILKPVKSFEWDEYLKAQNGVPAPSECFNQPPEPPVNEFRVNQKLELNSPTNDFDFVHLASVVSYVGPRLQLRLDGCDSSNDIFELVDSQAIHPVGARLERKKYFAAPLRFRKDAASYNSFCKSILKSAEFAPKTAFKKPPQEPRENLFKQGMKLEAVDQKHPSNICPATIAAVDKDHVTIHLDGWDDSNDYKCSYKARTLFPVGWCKKTGNLLQQPGPKAEIHVKTESDSTNSNLKTDEKEVSTAVRASTSTAGDVNKKDKETSQVEQPLSTVNKASVVTVTNNQTLHPKNTVINNKNEAKLTTPKPLTGAEVHANSSAPTGAKLVNEPPKTQNSLPPVNHSATTNSHKSISVSTNKLPATASALSPLLPPSLPVPSSTSTVVGANMIRNPQQFTASKFSLTKTTSQGTTMVPIGSIFVSSKSVSSNNSNNIHISPKRNNVGEQIKQQQQLQQQQHQVQQPQFMQKPVITNCQVLVTQPSTLQMNNTQNNNRGFKRPQPPLMNSEPRKSQAVMHTMKPCIMSQNNSSFHTFNKSTTQTTVVPNPLIMSQQGQFLVGPLQSKVPISQNAALTLNNNNNNAVILTTNHVPVVNACKKPSAISTHNGNLPDPNIVENWTEDEVIAFLSSMLPDFSKYESLFRSQEIDGKAFRLLTNEFLIKYMGIKLGCSLKICNIVDQINGSD